MSTGDESKAPAGWYPDPDTGLRRYWDGAEWDPDPARGAPLVSKQWELEHLGYIFVFLFPIVGLVIGVILLARNRVGPGLLCVLGAVVMALLYSAAWSSLLRS